MERENIVMPATDPNERGQTSAAPTSGVKPPPLNFSLSLSDYFDRKDRWRRNAFSGACFRAGNGHVTLPHGEISRRVSAPMKRDLKAGPESLGSAHYRDTNSFSANSRGVITVGEPRRGTQAAAFHSQAGADEWEFAAPEVKPSSATARCFSYDPELNQVVPNSAQASDQVEQRDFLPARDGKYQTRTSKRRSRTQ